MHLAQMTLAWSWIIILVAALPSPPGPKGLDYLREWTELAKQGRYWPTPKSTLNTLPFPSLKKALKGGPRTEELRQEICAQCMSNMLKLVGRTSPRIRTMADLFGATGI